MKQDRNTEFKCFCCDKVVLMCNFGKTKKSFVSPICLKCFNKINYYIEFIKKDMFKEQKNETK